MVDETAENRIVLLVELSKSKIVFIKNISEREESVFGRRKTSDSKQLMAKVKEPAIIHTGYIYYKLNKVKL